VSRGDYMAKQTELLAKIVYDATEEEQAGKIHYDPHEGSSSSTRHNMQSCGCRVIGGATIVRFCGPHQAWWDFVQAEEEATREERWKGLDDATVARFNEQRAEEAKRWKKIAELAKTWDGYVSPERAKREAHHE
jgi:hypothetical protein